MRSEEAYLVACFLPCAMPKILSDIACPEQFPRARFQTNCSADYPGMHAVLLVVVASHFLAGLTSLPSCDFCHTQLL
eukprot:1244306-Amphidinium_carterae.1